MEKLKVGIAMSIPAIKRKCLGHVIQVQKSIGQERAVNALTLAWGKKRMCLKDKKKENKWILPQMQQEQNNRSPSSKPISLTLI